QPSALVPGAGAASAWRVVQSECTGNPSVQWIRSGGCVHVRGHGPRQAVLMRFPGWRLSVFLMALAPAIYWFAMAAMQRLGHDPGKILLDNFGQAALCLLLITLLMTPLQWISGWSGWLAVRRQLGLWVFAYAVLHLLGYLVFILGG